jgi:hypothetical protein
MKSIHGIKHIITAAFLVVVFCWPLQAKNITAQEYFSQPVDYTPPKGFLSKSGGQNGGIQYVFKEDQSDKYGRIDLKTTMIMPDLTLKDLLAYKLEKISKNDNITVKKAKIGDLDGRGSIIIEYRVDLWPLDTLHIKEYYVPLKSHRKGQVVFAPVVLSGDEKRLKALDRTLLRIKFKETVDLSGS